MIPRKTIGWREWVSFPDLGIPMIKAKVDTGARSSSLHAMHIKEFKKRGKDFVSFQVHPFQNNIRQTVKAEAEVLDKRLVKSSSGHVSQRFVIKTTLELLGESIQIDLNLASRDQMGFRCLIGRQALRKKFVVDPARSFLTRKKKI
jgi:hypothetical protein